LCRQIRIVFIGNFLFIRNDEARNLLYTPYPPNDSVLVTRGESDCTLFVRVLCYGVVDEGYMWATKMAQTNA